MYCIRFFLGLIFLFAYPTASSYFVVLFLISLMLNQKPCIYCSILLVAAMSASCSLDLSIVRSADSPTSTRTATSTSSNETESSFFDPRALLRALPTPSPINDPNVALPSVPTPSVFSWPKLWAPTRCWCTLRGDFFMPKDDLHGGKDWVDSRVVERLEREKEQRAREEKERIAREGKDGVIVEEPGVGKIVVSLTKEGSVVEEKGETDVEEKQEQGEGAAAKAGLFERLKSTVLPGFGRSSRRVSLQGSVDPAKHSPTDASSVIPPSPQQIPSSSKDYHSIKSTTIPEEPQRPIRPPVRYAPWLLRLGEKLRKLTEEDVVFASRGVGWRIRFSLDPPPSHYRR